MVEVANQFGAGTAVPLCNITLKSLPSDIQIPQYERSEVTTGVVHIGPSHFARAHILRYFDDILEQDPSWGVTVINVRQKKEGLSTEWSAAQGNPEKNLKERHVAAVLERQDYLYTIAEQSVEGVSRRVIGSITDMISAPDEPQQALAALTNPDVKLVTLTLTEGGYGHDPKTGQLDFSRPDIKACIESMDGPSTAVGYLVAAIEQRWKDGSQPLTIMSCDNMAGNGQILENAVLAYAGARSRDLRRYIEQNISFPNTMVDRIVPGVTAQHLEDSKKAGVHDAWPVVSEGFSEWVIENDFSTDQRPPLERVGVQLTDDVFAHELRKIRMLNGAHVATGIIGKLAGYEYVDEAILNPDIERFIEGFMVETARTLKPLEGVDYGQYAASLMTRLKNPYMQDELPRLPRNATTGKLATRILAPLKDAMAQGHGWDHLAFVTAAWVQYLKGYDDQGTEFDIKDPNAVETGLQDLARKSNGNPKPIISASGMFGTDLQGDPAFMKAIQTHLHNIQQHGVVAAASMIDRRGLDQQHSPKLRVVG